MSDLDLELLQEWVPELFDPSDELRTHAREQLEARYRVSPAAPTRRPRVARQFGRRVAIAALAAAVLIAGALVWVQREVDNRVDRIKTVTVPNGVLGNGEIGKGPVNILVIGSDSRVGLDPAQFGSPSDTGPPKSDTAFLLRIDGSSVQGLWIPRDLIVDVDGAPALFNSAFNTGPQRVIETIKQEFGVVVDHYVEVNFNSFRRVVDAVGGVAVFTPGPVRDPFSGLNLPTGGCQTLDGNSALAWVRSRHLELLQNGVWTDASPRADLDRAARQQQFIRALAGRAKSEAGVDPAAAVRLADAVLPGLKIDQGFGRDEILGLVRTLAHVDPSSLQLATLPVQESATQAGRVVLAQPDATAALAPFKGEHPPTAAPPSGQSLVPTTSLTHAC